MSESNGKPIVSMIAIVLSVAALLTSVIEVTFIRQELRAEAWPYISVNRSYNQDGFGIWARNKGVGPARVRSVTLLLDGKQVNDLDQAIIDTVGSEQAFSYELYKTQNPAPGVMSADEEIGLFSVPWQPNTRLLANEWQQRLEVSICYCSIYDECWRATLDAGDPKAVDYCTSSELD